MFHFFIVLFLLFLNGVAFNLHAEEIGAFEINAVNLREKIETMNTRQGLDESIKNKILKYYQQAQDNLTSLEQFQTQIQTFKLEIKQAPDKTKKLEKEIEQASIKFSKSAKNEEFSRISIEELDQRLIIEKGKMSSLDEQIQKLDNEIGLQINRPAHIREEIVLAQQDIENTWKKLQISVDNFESKLESEARQLYLKTMLDMRAAELKMLDAEALSNPARVEFLKTQLQWLNVQKNALSPTISAIESIVFELRQQEAKNMEDALIEAEKAVEFKHAIIKKYTHENIEYSHTLQSITAKIESYSEQKTQFENQTSNLETEFKSAEKKISLAQLSPELGKMLREQRRNLVKENQYIEQTQILQNETALISLEQFKLEDKQKLLIDVDVALKKIMQTHVEKNLSFPEQMMIQAELRVLLNNQKELLSKLVLAQTTYLRTLGDVEFAQQQLLVQAGKFATYLDERLLWVKSSEPVNVDMVSGLYESLQWLFSPTNWLNVFKDSVNMIFKHVSFIPFVISGLIGLIWGQRWIKHHNRLLEIKTTKIHTDHFHHTLTLLGHTLLCELPAPLCIYLTGWFLQHALQIHDFSHAVGFGLQKCAITLLIMQFFYRIFSSDGVARRHFQWRKSSAQVLHEQLGWLRFVNVPAIFLINLTSATKVAEHSDYLGRFALLTLMAAIILFIVRLFKASHSIFTRYLNSITMIWMEKLRYVWLLLILIVPLIISGFAIMGYYSSAVELQEKFIATLRLIFAMMLIHELIVRWLTLVNRQLALKNAEQKRKAESQNEKHVAGSEDPILPSDEQQIDIPKINAQTLKLVNLAIGFSLVVGFGVIWQNILPAFSFLDDIVLWQHKIILEGQETYEPITLTNLLLAGLYIFIAIVSVRNFSGLMELLIFQRLQIEAGGRYAVNQLAKYCLISIAFICVANVLGGSWSQVQWLVAALSVGLGFGLQEIFANLVSGIILLFERPIRVGDTVTIGEVTGKVSRIQMRATTLIDWDQKELIVPNKTFITSQLVNWTLSDAITRVVIPVGIAFGSNVELAHQIMLETVRNTPRVLKEPEPSVIFMGFGESALNFSVRIFVNELMDRLPVTHDVHVNLEKALREHGIEIPFPQMEVHLHPKKIYSAELNA